MDIKAKVEEVVAKVKADPQLLTKFKADPAGTVKEMTGLDISSDEIKNIAKSAVEKFNLDADGDGKIDFLENIEGKLDSDGDGKPDLGAVGNILGGFLKK